MLITSTENEKKKHNGSAFADPFHLTLLDNIIIYALLVRACPFLIALDQALVLLVPKWGGLRKSNADLHEHSGSIQEAKEAPRQEENPQHLTSISHIALCWGGDNDLTRLFFAKVADPCAWTHFRRCFRKISRQKNIFNINIALNSQATTNAE